MCHPERSEESHKILNIAIRRLAAAGVPDPKWDAEELLEWAGGPDRSHLPLWDGSLDEGVLQRFEEGLALRAKRVPLQQIVGKTWFMGLPFRVTNQVLCPRPDTECLVERALEIIKKQGWEKPRILDLCCGSGCIGISLAHFLPDAQVIISDISAEALEVARANARENGALEGLRFARGDMLEAVLTDTGERIKELPFDLICCNPPYIPGGEIEVLMPEVRVHEPRLALDGGKDGLDFYRRLAADLGGRRLIASPTDGCNRHSSLDPGEEELLCRGRALTGPQDVANKDYLYPSLLLEIGCEQAAAVTEIFRAAGYRNIRIFQDLAGLDRVVEVSQ